jgi:hypothetical protein
MQVTGACGREHRGTSLLRELSSDTADSASASLYKHRLTRTECAKVDKALASGERNGRYPYG